VDPADRGHRRRDPVHSHGIAFVNLTLTVREQLAVMLRPS
jgi:hypothetical protein